MRDSRPQLPEHLFSDTSCLKEIQQRAVALLKLNRALKALLPLPLQPWCRVANYRQGILILEVANGSWLSRLRYEQPQLLTALRGEILPSLVSIDIRINPALMTDRLQKTQSESEKPAEKQNSTTPNDSIRKLSPVSADYLRLLSKNCPDSLKKKLERLASLAGENANDDSPKR